MLSISYSVAPFSCPQSFPASGSFPMSWLFTLGGQSIGAAASASVFPVNIQGWFPLGLTGLISLTTILIYTPTCFLFGLNIFWSCNKSPSDLCILQLCYHEWQSRTKDRQHSDSFRKPTCQKSHGQSAGRAQQLKPMEKEMPSRKAPDFLCLILFNFILVELVKQNYILCR